MSRRSSPETLGDLFFSVVALAWLGLLWVWRIYTMPGEQPSTTQQHEEP